MVQCPDCEEKNKIVIAGKVFCANCGTPWQASQPKPKGEASGILTQVSSVSSTPKKPAPAPATTPASSVKPTQSPHDKSTDPVQSNIKPQPSKPKTDNKSTPLKPVVKAQADFPQAQKIENIDDRLAEYKKSNPTKSFVQEPKKTIVKEISSLLSVPSSVPIVPNMDDEKVDIKPVIPHSPIGDLEDEPLIYSTTAEPDNQGMVSNLNLVDGKVLALSQQPVAIQPIPSERIAAAINEVITSQKTTSPSRVQPTSVKDFNSQTVRTNSPISLSLRSPQERLQTATNVPQSMVINKFQATAPPAVPAKHVTAPPPPPPPKKVVPPSPAKATEVETFHDLAKTIPIKQPDPIKVATAPSPTVTSQSAPQAKQASQTLDNLTKIIGQSDESKSSKTATASSNTPDATVKTDPIAVARAATITPKEQVEAGPTEHIGSEIVSLDKDDESILSDAEFKQLSDVKTSPTIKTTAPDAISQVPQKSSETKISSAPTEATPQSTPSKPKTLKPLDITLQNSKKPATSNVAEPAKKSDHITVLPPSPDGITPGAAFKPSQAVDYPVMKQEKPAEPIEEKALTEATALDLIHQHAAEKAKLPQAKVGHSFTASSAVMSIVGLILVAGYIWQVNYPNLAFKVAASKAGINANAPSYVPSGWKLSNNIKTSPGVVSYNIESANNKQQVAITQAKTDWDSQALAENYVTSKSAKYLALQAQGLTIYMYGDNQASWINHGNWYRLEGQNHGLDQDQIIKIATSL